MEDFIPKDLHSTAKRSIKKQMTLSIKKHTAKLDKITNAMLLEKQLSTLEKNPDFIKMCQDEFDILIDSITTVEDRSRVQFKEFCVIYFEEISEAIINQIDQEIT